MIEVIENKSNDRVIEMGEMKPLQVGVIIEGVYVNSYVMRTASADHFEVIDLSNAGVSNCWTYKNNPIKVRLLGPGESLVIELKNDE